MLRATPSLYLSSPVTDPEYPQAAPEAVAERRRSPMPGIKAFSAFPFTAVRARSFDHLSGPVSEQLSPPPVRGRHVLLPLRERLIPLPAIHLGGESDTHHIDTLSTAETKLKAALATWKPESHVARSFVFEESRHTLTDAEDRCTRLNGDGSCTQIAVQGTAQLAMITTPQAFPDIARLIVDAPQRSDLPNLRVLVHSLKALDIRIHRPGVEALRWLMHLHLTHLSMSHCGLKDDDAGVIVALGDLKKLDISGNQISDAGAALLSLLPLVILSAGFNPLTPVATAKFARNPALRSLDAAGLPQNASSMLCLARHPALNVLNLDLASVPPMALTLLTHSRTLTDLSLRDVNLSQEAIYALLTMRSMQRIAWSDGAYAKEVVPGCDDTAEQTRAALQLCASLTPHRPVDIDGNASPKAAKPLRHDQITSIKVTDPVQWAVVNMQGLYPALRSIEIAGCRVSDMPERLSLHRSLTVLSFSASADSDLCSGFSFLQNLPLRVLRLSNVRIGQREAHQIAALTALTGLLINDTGLRDTALGVIAKLPLRTLEIRGNPVTSAAVAGFLRINSTLRNLSLSGVKMGKNLLAALHEHPSLTTVDL